MLHQRIATHVAPANRDRGLAERENNEQTHNNLNLTEARTAGRKPSRTTMMMHHDPCETRGGDDDDEWSVVSRKSRRSRCSSIASSSKASMSTWCDVDSMMGVQTAWTDCDARSVATAPEKASVVESKVAEAICEASVGEMDEPDDTHAGPDTRGDPSRVSHLRQTWHGSSVARNAFCRYMRRYDLTITRPAPDAVTSVDMLDPLVLVNGKNTLTVAPTRRTLWDIERTLQTEAVSIVVKRTSKESKNIVYMVPVIGSYLPSRAAAVNAAKKNLLGPDASEIYRVLGDSADGNFNVRLEAKLILALDDFLQENRATDLCPLKFSLSAPRGASSGVAKVKSARCRAGKGYFAPIPGRAGKDQHLEVDLGGLVDVAAVSTSARPTPTVVFPTRKWLERAGIRRWTGKQYHVIDYEARCASHARYFQRCELFYRSDKGSPWIRYGVIKGPSSDYEEKLIRLKNAGHASETIKCRFLRFVPVCNPEHAPASTSYRGLQVDVFGIASQQLQNKANAQASSAAGPLPTESFVEYRLEAWGLFDHAPKRGRGINYDSWRDKSTLPGAVRKERQRSLRLAVGDA